MDSSFSPKDKIWFLRVCHHISTVPYHPTPPYAAVSTVFCLNASFINPTAAPPDTSYPHCRAATATGTNRISRMPDKYITLRYTSLLPRLPLHAIRPSTHEINVESLKTAFKRKTSRKRQDALRQTYKENCAFAPLRGFGLPIN